MPTSRRTSGLRGHVFSRTGGSGTPSSAPPKGGESDGWRVPLSADSERCRTAPRQDFASTPLIVPSSGNVALVPQPVPGRGGMDGWPVLSEGGELDDSGWPAFCCGAGNSMHGCSISPRPARRAGSLGLSPSKIPAFSHPVGPDLLGVTLTLRASTRYARPILTSRGHKRYHYDVLGPLTLVERVLNSNVFSGGTA